MSSLVNFFNDMNISDTGGGGGAASTTPSQTRTTASPSIRSQRRFAFSVPNNRTSYTPFISNSSSKPIASKPIASKSIGSKRKLESCVICLQNCTSTSSAKPDGCDHAVCDTCLRAYFQNALTDTRYQSFEHIQCPNPDCEALFVSEKVVRNIFNAKQRNDWWTTATVKTFIENKVECPFVDCKAVFDADVKLMRKCTFAECYECRRGVCTACQSPWHPGVIKIVDDQEELKKTLCEAKEKSWTRCPKCQHLVERKNGCNTMLCKCGTEFCYRCGGYSNKHTCTNNCHLLAQDQIEALRSQMFASTSNLTHTKMRKVR